MIEYRILTEYPDSLLREAAELYRIAHWLEPEASAAFLRPAWSGSFAVAGAFDGEHIVGMGRALSDGASDAYIQDVAVSPAYRKRGIGGELVKLLIRTLRGRGIDWIALVGEPGTEDFYAGLHCLTRRDGHTLWLADDSGKPQ